MGNREQNSPLIKDKLPALQGQSHFARIRKREIKQRECKRLSKLGAESASVI